MAKPSVSPLHREKLSLIADVGGTNTRVALADGAVLRPDSIERFRNSEHASLGAVLEKYLAGHGHPDCDAACAAIAGPVENGVADMTNLDWQIDEATLARAAQAESVALLNDLQAQGFGIAHAPPDKLRSIVPGAQAAPDAAQIVIGVGTGFNIAPVYHADGRRVVTASESGHSSLPVHTAADLRLAQFVGQTHGFADIEEVLSGRGVENIRAWLCAEAGAPARISAAEIFASFEEKSDPHSHQTAALVARFLGIVAGDLALIHLPYGGIYLSGGVARAFGPHLVDLGFADAFRSKGRFSDLMERFSIHIIEDDFAALAGCAGYLDER